MRIRPQRYNITVKYKPGKEIPVAGTLSQTGAREEDSSEDLDLESYVEGIMKEMPVSDDKLKDIRNATENDAELPELRHCIKQGWPETLKGERRDQLQFRATGTVEMKLTTSTESCLKEKKSLFPSPCVKNC